MAVISPASYLQAGSYTAAMDRRLLMSGFDARPGVVPRTATLTDLKVSQRGAGANMSVDVAEGSVVVMGTEATYQGMYYGENQGTLNVVVTAANATNPRRDLIVARVSDAQYSGAANTFTIEIVTGTAAASPVDPTVPANCQVLARVAVAANASSITNANITDLRTAYTAVTGSAVIGNQVRATGLGGVLVCTSAQRPTVGLYEGLVIYETDTHLKMVYTGSAWTWDGTRGLVGHGASGADQNGIVASIVDLTGVTTGSITIPTGRNIKIEAFGGVYKAGGDTSSWAQLFLQNGATTLGSSNTYSITNTYTHALASVILKGTLSGTVTIKAQMASSIAAPGYVNTQAGFYIAVTDLGPT